MVWLSSIVKSASREIGKRDISRYCGLSGFFNGATALGPLSPDPLHHLLLRLQNLLAHPLLILAHRLLKRDWIERHRGLLRDGLCGKPNLRGGHRSCHRRCRCDGVVPEVLTGVP